MARPGFDQADTFYAETYDACVLSWPGELAFYRQLAEDFCQRGKTILELACGTGRVTLALAETGCEIVGLDNAPAMLAVAKQRGAGKRNVRWVLGDMRSFALDRRFGLIIIPGHSFQNLCSPEEQVSCLSAVLRHLDDGGALVVHLDHQDIDWLARISGPMKGVFEEAETFTHPSRQTHIQTSRAWSYEPSTQTAVVETIWTELDQSGVVLQRLRRGPIPLHCVFRFEMEHLLQRSGYTSCDVYGDFQFNPLTDDASEMIWFASAASRPADLP